MLKFSPKKSTSNTVKDSSSKEVTTKKFTTKVKHELKNYHQKRKKKAIFILSFLVCICQYMMDEKQPHHPNYSAGLDVFFVRLQKGH